MGASTFLAAAVPLAPLASILGILLPFASLG